MNMERYWCDKCIAFILPVLGIFRHPHLGERIAYMCPKDKYLVYPREEKPKEVA